MQLFLVTCEWEGGNLDRFISALDAEQALYMWTNSEWVQQHGAHEATGVRVFRVPSVNPTPMMHNWHEPWAKRGVELKKAIP